MSGNELVRLEIETFLLALASYADRFATDPQITFEEYRSSLAAAVPSAASSLQDGIGES